jgi:hypothetical protein
MIEESISHGEYIKEHKRITTRKYQKLYPEVSRDPLRKDLNDLIRKRIIDKRGEKSFLMNSKCQLCANYAKYVCYERFMQGMEFYLSPCLNLQAQVWLLF